MVGLIVAGQALGRLLGDLPAGMIQGRIGQKRSLAAGIVVMLISTALLFWANSIPMVLALRLITGFGQAMTAVARTSYIATVTATGERGRSVSLLGGAVRAGLFIGPVIGGSLAVMGSLRTPFLVYGAIMIAALALFTVFTPSTRPSSAADRHIQRYSRSLVSTISTSRRSLLTAGTGQMFFFLIRKAPREIIIPLFAAEVLGLNAQSIGMIISVSAALDMTLFYPAGWIMDRFGRKYAIVMSLLGLAIGTVLIPFVGSYTGLLLVGLLIGFGNGIGSGTMTTLGADLAPAAAREEFISLWQLIGDTGQAGAPLVVGWIADLLTLSTSPWVVAGIGLAGALVFTFGVQETLVKEQPQLASIDNYQQKM
jgi:MFS family permease